MTEPTLPVAGDAEHDLLRDAAPAAAAADPLARLSATWAEVRAHEAVMRYRRSGVGRTVIVLRPAGDGTALWPELLERLAARHRLIVPELSADDEAAGRLASFLEGLGCADVTLVAAGGFAIPSLELALGDGDQVARLVVVPDGHGATEGLHGGLVSRLRGAALPFLLVRRELPVADALALVLDFVDGGRADEAAAPASASH